MTLSVIGAQQDYAIEKMLKAINQILDYCATYLYDGMVYRSSGMIMNAHSDSGFNNEKKKES